MNQHMPSFAKQNIQGMQQQQQQQNTGRSHNIRNTLVHVIMLITILRRDERQMLLYWSVQLYFFNKPKSFFFFSPSFPVFSVLFLLLPLLSIEPTVDLLVEGLDSSPMLSVFICAVGGLN